MALGRGSPPSRPHRPVQTRHVPRHCRGFRALALGPTPVSTAYTLAFVQSELGGRPKRLIEVGCGAGELAAALVAQGHDVTAIDSDADAVAATRAREVDAVHVAWPINIGQPVDAVVFTRSLHHIEPLDEAVAAAFAQLNGSGLVIVEDFRSEGAGAASVEWFGRQVAEFQAAGHIASGFDSSALLDELQGGHHDHDLHSSHAIGAALGVHGPTVEQDAAYYFRYLERVLSSADCQQLFKHELAAIASGVPALGKRFVARGPLA